MDNDEKRDRIEQLKWNLDHCKGWVYFGKIREWTQELQQLEDELDEDK